MSEGKQQRHRLPLFQGIRPLSRGGAIRDALAGVQLAAMNIPQALGYTKIAGMPVVTGFYTLLLPMLAFAVFGSSRYLVVAADSATAAILAGGLSTMAPLASARYVALAGAVALLTACFLLLARILKLGFLADFLSQTVLVGFLTGVGFQVGIAVFGGMLGLEIESHKTVSQLIEIYRGLAQVHLPTVLLSAVVVAGVFAIAWISPKVPGPLIAVAGAVAASAIWNFAGHGITVIGPVAGGLPHLGLPDVRWRDTGPLISIAASCFVMIVAQSAATARIYAVRHQQRLDENEDLVGLAAANASAALSGTFVVNGSPTQTAMVESSGGQSQLAQVATAVVVALVLLFAHQASAIPAALCAGRHRVHHRHQADRSTWSGEDPAGEPGRILPGGDHSGGGDIRWRRAGNCIGDDSFAAADCASQLSSAYWNPGCSRRWNLGDQAGGSGHVYRAGVGDVSLQRRAVLRQRRLFL